MATIHDLTKYLGQPDGPLGPVIEMFPDMVFVVDREEQVLHLNTLAARALGGTPTQFIGRKLGSLFPPALAARHSRFIQQVFRTGKIVVTETHQELHAKPVWIDSRLVPLKAADDEVMAVVGIIRDVTARVNAQESLAVREAYLRAMLDNFPFPVWLKDVNGCFLAVNQTFARTCGRASPAGVVGLTDFDVWPKDLAQRYTEDDRSVMATHQQKDIEEPIFSQGVSRWFETFKTPVLDQQGTVLGTTGFARDITDRQRLNQELRAQREQLRALAAHVESVREEERVRIAREIHDELGQALTCMSMDLAFLDKQLPKGDERAAARVAALAALVKETVKTVRRISSELRPSILDDLGLAPALEWLAHDFEGRTNIRCAVSVPSTINISAERGTVVFRMCQEALTNVARHAEASQVSIDLVEADDNLTLEVRDNGRGITEEEVQRPDSLGLLGMRERAALLGGVAEVKGAPGQGTSLTVRVPLRDSEADTPEKPVQP
jgi:two-component system, NarL family, sensor histidine kinase UhpB